MDWSLSRVWTGLVRGNLSPAESARYSRQIAMEYWGLEAQEKLKASRVFIAGAGSLASSLAVYLITAGVGRIRLVDKTRISLESLNCQIFYREKDLGKSKATIAGKRLAEVNPFVEVDALEKNITDHNALKLTEGFDLLVDTINNYPAQMLINRASVAHQVPLVHAAVGGVKGRISTFWPGRGPCLACAFPDQPPPLPPGLLSPLTGIIGSLMSLEVLMILGEMGPALVGRMLTFDGNAFHMSERSISANPSCPSCHHP